MARGQRSPAPARSPPGSTKPLLFLSGTGVAVPESLASATLRRWRASSLDSANVRRSFRSIATAAGLDAANWTPRELRHSFVSIMSDAGVPIEQIARLIGHAGRSAVTETVYRKQLRPVVQEGAAVMDRVLARRPASGDRHSVRHSAPPETVKRPGRGLGMSP